MVAPHLDRCLDDESAAWFVGGKGTDTDRERVDAHLDACAPCRRRIAALALVSPPVTSFVAAGAGTDDLATEPAPPPAPSRDGGTIPALGERIGRYVVLRTLGRGGMGVVVAAHDPELDRQVAIKLVHPTLWRTASREARELLRSEARAMARLVHPNVVTVHDLGTIEDQLFVAMELVAGTSLDQWLKAPRGWREALAVCIGAGRGIAAAHRAGLVHRDVKPHNVLIDPDGRARIADFGLAMLPRLDSPSQSPAGTPAYMSPEQHRCEQVGPASDQFSFCVMVYEALFGERPFGGRTVAEVALEVSEGRIKPPPARSKVPRPVRRALLRGLATDADARWPSMDALLDALAPRPTGRRAATAALGVVAAGAVTFALLAARDRDPDEAARSSAREAAAGVWNPGARDGISAAFAGTGHARAPAIAASVASGLDRFVERWVEARVLVARRNRDGDDPLALSRGRRDCLDRRLGDAAALIAALRNADKAVVDSATEAIRRMTPVSICTEGEGLAGRAPPPVEPARRQVADELQAELARITALDNIGKSVDAIRDAERVLAAARQLDHAPLTAEALYVLGGAYGAIGKIADAEKTLEEALVEVARAGDDELGGRIWTRFLGIAAAAGEVERVRGLAPGANAAIARSGRTELRVWVTDALGTAENAGGDFEKALALHTEALALARDEASIDRADLGFLMLHQGGDLVELGRVDEARAVLKEGRALVAAELGDSSGSLIMFDIQEALLQQASGEIDALLATAERIGAATTPGTAQAGFAKFLRASALHELGRIEEATVLFRETAEDFQRLGDTQREYESRLNLGVGFYALGKYDEAATELDRAIELAERTFARTDWRLADVHSNRGIVALEAGELDRARTQCKMAHETFSTAAVPDIAYGVVPLICLSRVDRLQGRVKDALVHIREAQRIADLSQNPAALLEVYDELAVDLAANGDRKGAIVAAEQAIVAAKALGQPTPELDALLAKWKRSHR